MIMKKSKTTSKNQNTELQLKTMNASLQKFTSTDLKTQTELLSIIHSLLLTAYGNTQAAKGALAILHENNLKTPPVLMMCMETREPLDMMWENEKILGNILDGLEGLIEHA